MQQEKKTSDILYNATVHLVSLTLEMNMAGIPGNAFNYTVKLLSLRV